MSTLEVIVFDDEIQMSHEAAVQVIDGLKSNPNQLLCVAAGFTSSGLLNELCGAYNEGLVDFSKASFIAMDEWTGMNKDTPGSCGWFLCENFLSKVNYRSENVFLWNGKACDFSEECVRAKKFIQTHSKNRTIDKLILGIGMNGHLALNEPGASLKSTAHIVDVDSVTAKVGQKYFKQATSITGGLTLGLSDFMNAKDTILLVSGEKKRNIFSELIKAGEFKTELPASALYEFTNAIVFCDKAVASHL